MKEIVSKRNPIFDIMKGLGIIAVVIGHSAIPKEFMHFLFVWHMPLFFIISGYFFHPQEIGCSIKKNSRNLLLPYIVTAVTMFVLAIGLFLLGKNVNITNALGAIFVGAGTSTLPMFSQYFIGAIWFLLAMFWCRVIYNILYSKLQGKWLWGGIVVLFLLTLYCYDILYIPTNLMQGMNALLFFHFGHEARRNEYIPQGINWMLLSLMIIFTVMAMIFVDGSFSPIRMVACYYGCWPIDIVAAILCTYGIYLLSKFLMVSKTVCKFFIFYGRISLLVLCVHIIDLNYGNYIREAVNIHILHFGHWQKAIYIIIWNLSAALLISYILSKNALICKIFKIK